MHFLFQRARTEPCSCGTKRADLAECEAPNGASRGRAPPHYTQKKVNCLERFNGKDV